MHRRAFGLLEVLIVVGVLGAVTSLSIPLYNEYQIRSDLEIATQQTTQGLDRAKLLSQSAERDTEWGFYVPSGTLYKGESYEFRDTAFDEVYPMPSTIAVTGLFDVSFSKVKGIPSSTGSIVLRALNNDERLIQVSIAVEAQQLATNESDTLTICHYDGGVRTAISIPDATWPSHQSHGDTLGTCPTASSSVASVASSSRSSSSRSSSVASSVASSSAAAVSSSAAGGGGGASSSAACKFTLQSNGTIAVTSAATATFTNKLSKITFGAGGPQIPVHVCYKTATNGSLSGLFGGNGNCTGNGNAYGNAVKENGTDTATKSLSAGNNLAIQVTGRYKEGGWLAFLESYLSNDGSNHVLMLRNGNMLSNYPTFGNQTNLKSYLVGQGMANASGQITIGACQVLSITELGSLGTTSSDYQDNVMLINIQ